jgi:hypothetical protein
VGQPDKSFIGSRNFEIEKRFNSNPIFFTFLVASCEIETPSEELNESEVIGQYVPNHYGVETLQVRADHIWVRVYCDSIETRYVDSGSWGFIDERNTNYEIVLSNFFFRHTPWKKRFFWGIDSLGLTDMSYNSLYYAQLRKKRSKIRIILPYEYPSNYYEKTK